MTARHASKLERLQFVNNPLILRVFVTASANGAHIAYGLPSFSGNGLGKPVDIRLTSK